MLKDNFVGYLGNIAHKNLCLRDYIKCQSSSLVTISFLLRNLPWMTHMTSPWHKNQKEKIIWIKLLHFHYIRKKATHKNPCPKGHEIYNYDKNALLTVSKYPVCLIYVWNLGIYFQHIWYSTTIWPILPRPSKSTFFTGVWNVQYKDFINIITTISKCLIYVQEMRCIFVNT